VFRTERVSLFSVVQFCLYIYIIINIYFRKFVSLQIFLSTLLFDQPVPHLTLYKLTTLDMPDKGCKRRSN